MTTHSAISGRQRIRDAFAGRPSPLPPVSVRLDLWHRDARSRGELPAEVCGKTAEEVEDYLGFARAARSRGAPKLRLGAGDIVTLEAGLETRTEYRLPDRTLLRVARHTEDSRRAGMAAHVVRHPVASADDCRALAEALRGASLDVPVQGFDALDSATGDRGMPLFILGSCPAHHVMLSLTGYENFYYLLHDSPAEVKSLIAAFDLLMRRDLWPAAAACRAELVMHGNHFSSAMTPPPLFERYFLPYFAEFNRLMHGAGKKVLWHSDADVGLLLHHVLEAGFDGADCLATAPLVRESLKDYLDCWQGRIVCWGGLPSTIFDPICPMKDFRDYVDQTARVAAGRADVILGASDNVLPGAPWEKLLYLRDVLCR